MLSKPQQQALLHGLSKQVLPTLLKGVLATWRVQASNIHPQTQALHDAGQPVLYALWHGRLYAALAGFQQRSPAVLISQSRDGQMITNVAHGLGYQHVVRGSFGRGGFKASRAILDTLSERKQSILFFVDGPRGPRHQVKPGIIRLAANAQVPIVPVAIGAETLLTVMTKAWDHFHAPNFFSRMQLHLGAPILPPQANGTDDVERCRKALETALLQLTETADSVYTVRTIF